MPYVVLVVAPWMELSPHMGSDKTWMWSVQADFADEEPKEELLAIRFANPESESPTCTKPGQKPILGEKMENSRIFFHCLLVHED